MPNNFKIKKGSVYVSRTIIEPFEIMDKIVKLQDELEYNLDLSTTMQSEAVRGKQREFITTKLEMISATEAKVLEKVYVPSAGTQEIVIDLSAKSSKKQKKTAGERSVEKKPKTKKANGNGRN